MRIRNFVIAALGFFIFCSVSQGQDIEKNFQIETRPLFITFGVLDAGLSVKVSPHLDLLLSADVGYVWLLKILSPKEDFWGLGGGIGARWRAQGWLEDGFFAQAEIKTLYSKWGSDISGLLLTPSLGAGYGWHFVSGLFTSAGVDVYLPIAPAGVGKDKDKLPTKYPIPLLNWTVGYTF